MLLQVLVARGTAADTVTVCGGSGQVFGEDGSATEVLIADAPGAATIERVTVDLVIEHDWVGDLTVILSHAGDAVTLLERPAMPELPFGCGGDDVSVTLADDAATAVDEFCYLSPPAIRGTLRPEGSLSTFGGFDPSGAWTVQVIDSGDDDCGSIPPSGLCLHITYTFRIDFDGDGDVDLDDYAILADCLEGPETAPDPTPPTSVASCLGAFDVDDDGDVDLKDFAGFQSGF